MKSLFLIPFAFLLYGGFYSPVSDNVQSGKTVFVSVSEPDAKILSDGITIGNGSAEILIGNDACVNVRIEKVGFLTIERTYCNRKNFAEPPKKDYFKLEPDDAFNASVSTDVANVDISIKTDLPESEAWKLISQIITSYFDIIEVTDKETAYLRTSWVAQGFKSGNIRTRIIVKLGSSAPNLSYRVKLVSERCNDPKISVKNDEAFTQWDRVLRKYEGMIGELQSRLGK